MRYWTITNKTGRFWAVCVCLFLLVNLREARAQIGVLSPYSALGVGREVPYLNARSMGMGGIAVGLAGHREATPLNPASYYRGVDTLSVMFDIGFYLNMNSLRQDVDGQTLRNQSTGGGLGNMEFYFPVFKWWKMGVYLLPYTEVAYSTTDIRSRDDAHIGLTRMVHEGTGGLNRFGWGNAFGWGPVSVGINLNYQFGSIEEVYTLAFQNDSLTSGAAGSHVLTATRLNGLAIDVGLQYAQPLRHGHLSIGASYSLSTTMYAKRGTSGSAYYTYAAKDTAFFVPRRKGEVVIPGKLQVGVSYDDHSDWLVGVDFTYAWWSQYKEYEETYDYFRNTFRVAAGMELKPNYQSASAMRRVAYRIGGRYETYYADFGQRNLFGYAVNLGVGIPVRRSRSMINVGLEYGHVGRLKVGQIAENYFKIGVGFSSVETWFVKRKYD